ncbi:MAG: hypothetical protein AMXMBFR7_40480 [Planctomycetota bacterium]
MRAKVQAALDEIRPYIQADGGDVELVKVEDTVVTVRLMGHCVGCSSSTVTLKSGIETHLKKRVPEVTEVVQSMPAEPVATHPPPTPGQVQPLQSPFAPPPSAPATNAAVTANLRADHRKAEEVLQELDALVEVLQAHPVNAEQLRTLRRINQFLSVELAAHMRQEDEVLFPALVPFISWGSPMSMMAKEHRLLHEELDQFGKLVNVLKPGEDGKELARLGKRIAQRLRDDFYQEENVLFVEADESLVGQRADALREAMSRIAQAEARAH